jgi:hypothetical protein
MRALIAVVIAILSYSVVLAVQNHTSADCARSADYSDCHPEPPKYSNAAR